MLYPRTASAAAMQVPISVMIAVGRPKTSSPHRPATIRTYSPPPLKLAPSAVVGLDWVGVAVGLDELGPGVGPATGMETHVATQNAATNASPNHIGAPILPASDQRAGAKKKKKVGYLTRP